jgi:hypothetical protein
VPNGKSGTGKQILILIEKRSDQSLITPLFETY